MSSVLRFGSTGPAVKALQQALKDAGFNPGLVDGEFGTGTEQALLAFQRSEQMLPDGIAGPRTQTTLGLAADLRLPDATGGMTLQVASRMCPAAQLDNINANLPVVLASLAEHGLADRTMLLMAVATIRTETAGFMPVGEGRSRLNSSPGGRAFDLYDFRRDLGNQGPPDGERYRGRGFVQLTGRQNYRLYGQRLGLDLIEHPELASAAEVAADLLSCFLGDRELNIKDALLHDNLMAARRLVNGASHGLDAFTAAYTVGDAMLPA